MIWKHEGTAALGKGSLHIARLAARHGLTCSARFKTRCADAYMLQAQSQASRARFTMNLKAQGIFQGVGPTGQLPTQSPSLNALRSLVCFHSPAHLQGGDAFKSDLQLRRQGRQPVYSRLQIDQSRLRAPVVGLNTSFSAAVSARAREGDDDDGRQLGLGDPDGVVASSSKHWKPVLELHLVRGSSSLLELESIPAAADQVTTDVDPVTTDVDTEVPAKEMMWLMCAVTRFQLQLVSRKWRHEMPADELMWLSRAVRLFRSELGSRRRKWRQELTTAARFPKQLTESEEEQQQRERVVACVWPVWPMRSDSDHDSSGNSDKSDVNCEVLEVDLSFVPNSFWSKSECHRVMAAGHGLVCISNDSEKYHYDSQNVPSCERPAAQVGRPWSNRYCLLNPVTRTCIVLPEPPFQPDRWLLGSTSVAIFACPDTEKAGAQTVLSATYNLQLESAAAAGAADWVSARKLVLTCRSGSNYYLRMLCNWPPDGVLLGGQVYWYNRHDNEVHVTAAAGGVQAAAGGAQVIDGPSVTLLGLDEVKTPEHMDWFGGTYARSALVAHRGAIYFVGELLLWFHTRGAVCGVLRLGRSGVDGPWEWERVARLDKSELNRLTGFRSPSCVVLDEAYGARELLCCRLSELNYHRGYESRLLGFNLDKHRWELVYGEQPLNNAPMAFELRPDLFLSS